jgi:hypothetical protein
MDESDESPMGVYLREVCKAELAAIDERYREQLLEQLGEKPKRKPRPDFLPPYLRVVK